LNVLVAVLPGTLRYVLYIYANSWQVATRQLFESREKKNQKLDIRVKLKQQGKIKHTKSIQKETSLCNKIY
jgi:hypothetical protein